MRTVYRYPIPLTDSFSLDLPAGAEILSIQAQHGEPQLWALVNPSAPTETRVFRLAGTGEAIRESALRFVATFQIHGGSRVCHVFEITG